MKTGWPRAGRREQVALAVVAGVALLVAGRLALRRPSGEIPLLLVSPTPQAFLVHVAGEVLVPGVYRLPAGARWSDAVRAARGPTFLADLNAVNLAQTLRDGDRVFIPRQPEPVLSSGAEENEAPAGSGRATGATAGGAGREHRHRGRPGSPPRDRPRAGRTDRGTPPHARAVRRPGGFAGGRRGGPPVAGAAAAAAAGALTRCPPPITPPTLSFAVAYSEAGRPGEAPPRPGGGRPILDGGGTRRLRGACAEVRVLRVQHRLPDERPRRGRQGSGAGGLSSRLPGLPPHRPGRRTGGLALPDRDEPLHRPAAQAPEGARGVDLRADHDASGQRDAAGVAGAGGGFPGGHHRRTDGRDGAAGAAGAARGPAHGSGPQRHRRVCL